MSWQSLQILPLSNETKGFYRRQTSWSRCTYSLYWTLIGKESSASSIPRIQTVCIGTVIHHFWDAYVVQYYQTHTHTIFCVNPWHLDGSIKTLWSVLKINVSHKAIKINAKRQLRLLAGGHLSVSRFWNRDLTVSLVQWSWHPVLLLQYGLEGLPTRTEPSQHNLNNQRNCETAKCLHLSRSSKFRPLGTRMGLRARCAWGLKKSSQKIIANNFKNYFKNYFTSFQKMINNKSCTNYVLLSFSF